MRYAAGGLVLCCAALVLSALSPFHDGDDLLVFTLIAVPCFIAGAVVGRWPAIFLALLSVAFVAIASLASPDEDLGLVGAIYLTLVITVPFCGVAIAVGVGARKLAGRLAQGST